MRNERILVVGGAGYIGSHMVKDLLDAGHDVITLDDLSTGHRDLLPGGTFVEGDLGDKEILNRLFSSHGISAINLGGEVPMDQISQAVQQFRADIVGITFSGAYQYQNIRPHLLELRGLIPEDVEIWAGGEGVRRLRKLPEGVTKFRSLEKLPV